MTTTPKARALSVTTPLLEVVDEALELLETHSGYWLPAPMSTDPLPSLLEQCQRISADVGAREPEPIRTIHHFACTGGTLFSKCLATCANTQVLSEIDPLSTLPTHTFSPSDLILQLRHSMRSVTDDLALEIFIAGLQALYNSSCKSGVHLMLRDHAHSHFCTHQNIEERPTIRQVIRDNYPTLSVVTIRHPLDSFLSLQKKGWILFEPATLDEYACRYQAFLEAYEDTPVFKYEDLIENPKETQREICAVLQLPFNPDMLDLISVITLTGDSGRSCSVIGPRERRPIPDDIAQERVTGQTYNALCRRLDYDP